MLTDVEYAQAVFERGLRYEDYLATGTAEQQRRWGDMAKAVGLNLEQKKLIGSFVREMKVLVVSGIWCGDCVEQCPLIQAIAEASERIELRFIDRDEQEDLRDMLLICGGKRVPVVLFMAEDYAMCGVYGDRTLSRYRRLAKRQLGAACSTGLFVPEADEIAETLNGWLGEFERIQLMLRLSTRLREKHQD